MLVRKPILMRVLRSRRTEILFWILFLILNCVLFMPRYILESGTSHFFPFENFLSGTMYERFKSFFIRNNYDVFRLSVDLALIVLAARIFKNRININLFSRVAGIYYFVVLIFMVYTAVMFKLYRVKPILYNDLYLLGLGIQNMGKYYIAKLSLLLFLTAITGYFFVRLFHVLIRKSIEVHFSWLSKAGIFVVAFLFLINVIKSGTTFSASQTFHMSFAEIIDNITLSMDARNNLRHLDFERLLTINDYNSFMLNKKPDVYLLFFESYGKVLYDNDMLRPGYFSCLEYCDSVLSASGYFSASDFSVSPVSGGGSWISYTSVLYGFDVRNQGTYLGLLRNPDSPKYPHLINYLRKQGYYSYRLNAINEQSGPEIPLSLYGNFYGIDRWINFDDFGYHGKLYGFGPSPPDQYSLALARETIRKDNKQPHVLFFINQNSHNPFYCPDSIVTDWRSLSGGYDSIVQSSAFFKKPAVRDYGKAVCYDLQVFTQFIKSEQTENALYLIIGDHQPPVLSPDVADFMTQVHIISKDSLLIRSFKQYGFNGGLLISGQGSAIRHEAIYSMLLREMLRHYGSDSTHIPPYLPNGFILPPDP